MSSTESTYLSDWLAWEQDNRYSREVITVAASQTITTGEVLGKVTSTGHYVVFDQDAGTGEEAAAAIAIGAVTTGSGETASLAVIIRDAIVVEDNLTFPSDIDAGEQVTAMAELKALGIITKEEG